MQKEFLTILSADDLSAPLDDLFPPSKALPKPLSRDFQHFKSHLEAQKSNQLTCLFEEADYQDLDGFIELDIHSDPEEEGSPAQVDSILRDLSSQSVQSSPYDSPYMNKHHPSPAQRKHGSFLQENPSVFKDIAGSRRISLANIQYGLQAKKRNSELLDQKACGPLVNKYNSRKSMFEMIKRNSVKMNFEVSPSPIKDMHKDSSHSGTSSPELGFIEKEPRKKFSILNVQPFNFDNNEQIDSEPESESEISFEEVREVVTLAITQKLFSLSILRYGLHIFKTQSLCSKRVQNLRKVFMGQIQTQKAGAPHGILHNLESISRKFALSEKEAMSSCPFFLSDYRSFVRGDFKLNNQGSFNLLRDKKETLNDEKVVVYDICNVKSQENLIKDRYSFLMKRRDELPDHEVQAQTMSLYGNNLFSHSLPGIALKNLDYETHFQLMFAASESRFPVNMYPLVWLKYPSKLREKVVPGNILEKITQYLREDEIFIRDSFSKQGTFVRIEANNPMILTEGQLIMIDDKIGFYVKVISSDRIDNEMTQKEIKDCLEFTCLNHQSPDKDIFQVFGPLSGHEFGSESFEKRMKLYLDKEYKESLAQEGMPHVKLEVVKWNDELHCYEEKGGVYFLYNTKSYENEKKQKWLQLCHGKKNWCSLFSDNKVLRKLTEKLEKIPTLTLGYDPYLRHWFFDPSFTSLNNEQETYLPKEYLKNSPEKSDFQSYLKHNWETNSMQKIRSGINLNNFPNETSGEVWLSVSNFNILQENFNGEWVRVGPQSSIKFGTNVMKVGIEEVKVEYGDVGQ